MLNLLYGFRNGTLMTERLRRMGLLIGHRGQRHSASSSLASTSSSPRSHFLDAATDLIFRCAILGSFYWYAVCFYDLLILGNEQSQHDLLLEASAPFCVLWWGWRLR